MPLRVVLYAEGAGETGGRETRPPASGETLGEDWLGPGHVLVRRALARARAMEESNVLFESPLRTRRGRMPRGSDLLDRQTIRQLLTWPLANRRPDLAIVLIDADEDATRRRSLLAECTADLSVEVVVGVASQEFESWLIADIAAAARALGRAVKQPPRPESMNPREARELLDEWIAPSGIDSREVRLKIAGACDLDRVKAQCRSFEEFLRDLAGRR